MPIPMNVLGKAMEIAWQRVVSFNLGISRPPLEGAIEGVGGLDPACSRLVSQIIDEAAKTGSDEMDVDDAALIRAEAQQASRLSGLKTREYGRIRHTASDIADMLASAKQARAQRVQLASKLARTLREEM
eukprot:g2121.t1